MFRRANRGELIARHINIVCKNEIDGINLRPFVVAVHVEKPKVLQPREIIQLQSVIDLIRVFFRAVATIKIRLWPCFNSSVTSW